MSFLIMKFGGASLATPKKVLNVAEIIAKKTLQYEKIVVVVSAMGNTTNFLLNLSKKITLQPPKRELDMLVSAGERISISLLAMALSEKNINSVSFTGSQSGIITCSNHLDAKIIDVKPNRILDAFSKNNVVIVAGFQGVSLNKEITTLGRGGSDITAVALACSLKAEKVEFYKDVGGIYSKDPKKYLNAVYIPYLSFDEAIKIAKDKSKILHIRCLELAKKNNICLHIKSYKKKFAKKGSVIGKVSFEKVKKVVYEKEGIKEKL